MNKKVITRQDLAEASEKYKNWGKWGKDDEIGTLNFTSPDDIINAAKQVKKGVIVTLLNDVGERYMSTRLWDQG